ncbi:UPF0688 protein C1orf174 homolog [Microcaecilia unicolor]|uniref:UPF0688 protein C1orf174 homolog n=1 Tax=Microcaecilia unicolor TaxID=1415580 RepID=A0A6P7WL22_9AMPH|nr:UPF0688 protein C1orf174 homolog [Microcaecilia unicolor]
MRSRKFTGSGRSARQKSRTCRTDQETELCPSTRTVCLASSHKSEKRPVKKVKCEKSSLVKADLQELVCESGDSAEQHAVHPAEGSMTTGEKGKIIPKRENSAAVTRSVQNSSSCLPKTSVLPGDRNEGFDHTSLVQRATEDNSGDGSVLLNVTNLENREVLKTPFQSDTSLLLDEDSNQPMPLGRFFENADLMQDIPPVVPSHASMSRREFRKLHFKAKEDDDDDDEDDDIGEDL